MWREFYYTVGAYTPNFDKMEGNPICKQIPWESKPEYLKAWKEVNFQNIQTNTFDLCINTQPIYGHRKKIKRNDWLDHLITSNFTVFENEFGSLGLLKRQTFTTRSNLINFVIIPKPGQNGLSLYRRNHDAVKDRGLDSSFSSTCSCLFLNSWWLVGILGARTESKQWMIILVWIVSLNWFFPSGIWRMVVRCRLVFKCWKLDVAVCFGFLPSVLSCLQSYCLRKKNWQTRGLHKVSSFYLFIFYSMSR